ncbi:MAG: hypothetical protein JXB49_30760 [Bacteroidales bacterium]|nr:hypothetical protein [Bacteroidales bacterium]
MQKHDKLKEFMLDFFNPETSIYKKVHGTFQKVFYGTALIFFFQVAYHFLINS